MSLLNILIILIYTVAVKLIGLNTTSRDSNSSCDCFLLDMLIDFIEDYAHIKNPKLKEVYQ